MTSPHTKTVKDIVIDTNVIILYEAASDQAYKALFRWLGEQGTLTISQKLLVEYYRSGNKLLAGLINRLTSGGRLIRIENNVLREFSEDRRYRYSCNREDILHARLVFLSTRKLLVSRDNNLVADVNGFRKISGVKARATSLPKPSFYE